MMNEIRFRSSEDQLHDELMRRRHAHKWLGGLHVRCTHCGSYMFVISRLDTGTAECEQCWANRRYQELVGGSNAP